MENGKIQVNDMYSAIYADDKLLFAKFPIDA
jgi:hypothetical protein